MKINFAKGMMPASVVVGHKRRILCRRHHYHQAFILQATQYNLHHPASYFSQFYSAVLLLLLTALQSMLEGKAVIGETDMLQAMQPDALHLAAKSLDFFDVTDLTQIARFIKKEFDRAYGGGWQCIVGTDFGSFVTHCYGNFIYFRVGSLAILLFRCSAAPDSTVDDDETNQFAKLTIHTVEA